MSMSMSMSINRLLNPSQYQRQITIGTTTLEKKWLLIQVYCGSHLTHITGGLSRQGKILVIISDVCFHVIASVVSVLTILALKLLAFIVNSLNVSHQFESVSQHFLTFVTLDF